jgi:sugar phosphate isomerase/epimerase
MDRRHFLQSSAAALAAPAALNAAPNANAAGPRRGAPFRLKYAPHFGMFANHAPDLLDQLQFAADEGFAAWEDNGMGGRSPEDQEKIAAKMARCGIEMGVFVAHAEWSGPTFASGNKDHAAKILDDMHKAGYQTANVVDLLRRCAEITGAANLTIVLEPLNRRDHPQMFLTGMPQAYEVCRAVNSPFCKILDDLYHQQVTEGNLIPNIDRAWSEIAYFQTGDNPGRREPWTGEINYRNVFKHIHEKGFAGIVGMEHGKSQGGKEGEKKLIDAYRQADAF